MHTWEKEFNIGGAVILLSAGVTLLAKDSYAKTDTGCIGK
jgi:hypothetical protein